MRIVNTCSHTPAALAHPADTERLHCTQGSGFLLAGADPAVHPQRHDSSLIKGSSASPLVASVQRDWASVNERGTGTGTLRHCTGVRQPTRPTNTQILCGCRMTGTALSAFLVETENRHQFFVKKNFPACELFTLSSVELKRALGI